MSRSVVALSLSLVALVLLSLQASAAVPIERPTDAQWDQTLAAAGQWADLQVALEVMFAESGGNPMARNPSGARGPWQFMPDTIAEDNCAYDPVCSTAAAFRVSSGGRSWSKWEAYTSGAYQRQASRAAAAIAAAGRSVSAQPLPVLPPPQQPVSGAAPAPDSNQGMGVDGMIPPPPLRNGNSPFLYEKYVPGDYPPLPVDSTELAKSALGAFLGFTDPNQLAMNVSMNAAANLLISILVLIGVIATRLLAWSLRVDLLASADGPLNSVVAGLAHGLYEPLMPFMLTLFLGWLIYTWTLRRRAMRGAVGTGWMLTAMTLASIYFAAPSQILDNATAFTSSISTSILGAIGTADTTVHRGDPTVAQGSATDAELRLFSDRFWTVYIYQPWTDAEFGRFDPEDSSGKPLGVMLLDKHAGKSNDFDSAIQQQPQEVRDWYNGAKGGDRVIISGIAVLVAGVALVVFLFAAIVRLAASLLFLALLLGAPLFLLLALHPSIGRKVLMRVLELGAAALWRQIVYSLFLAVMVVLVGIASSAAAVGGWGLVAVCELAATAGVLIFRKPLLAIFGQMVSRRLATQHVGASRVAETIHQRLEAQRQRRPLPAFARGKAVDAGDAALAKQAGRAFAKRAATGRAASAGGTAAAGAASGGWLLAAHLAMKGGQVALRRGEDAKRSLQENAGVFMVDGHGGKAPARRMPEKRLGVDAKAVSGHYWGKVRRRTPAFVQSTVGGSARSGLRYGRPMAALVEGARPMGPSSIPRLALPPSREEQRAKARWVTLVHQGEDWNVYYSKGGRLPMGTFSTRAEALSWAQDEGWPVIEEGPSPTTGEGETESDEVIDV